MDNIDNIANCYRPHYRNALVSNLMQTRERIIQADKDCEDNSTLAFKYICVITYAILMRNEIVTNYAVDAIGIIKDDKQLYRHEVKKAVNEADKEVKNYNRMVGFVINNNSDLLDALDEISDHYSENINNAVQTFYYSLKQVLDSNNVEKSALRANLEFVSVLIQIALDEHKDLERCNVLLRKRIQYMDYLKMNRLSDAWSKLRDLVNGRYSKDINMNTERCQLACDNLERTMNDYKMIENLVNEYV